MFAVKAKIYGVLYKQSSAIAFDETSSYWSALKRTETSLITKSDQSGPNHHLLQLCTARTAWSDSDQAVRAMHSCNSWFTF